MRSTFTLLLCAAAAAGCVTGPLDGKKLSSHYEEFDVNGYYPTSGTQIELQVYNHATRGWEQTRGYSASDQATVTGGAPQVDAAGAKWYWFNKKMRLPVAGAYWGPTDAPRMRAARVRVRAGNVTLATFKSDADGMHNTDLAKCAGNQGWDGMKIHRNCRSGFTADLRAPCGGTGELCCLSGSRCDASADSCRNDYCVVADVPALARLDKWPSSGARDWVSDGLQGVTTNGTSWYFSTTNNIYRVSQNGLDSSRFAHVHKKLTVLQEAGVNHWGGMDFHNGYLWVSFENTNNERKDPKGIAVFDSNLNYVSHALLPIGRNKPFVAINPVDGLLYVADYSTDVKYLSAHRIKWSATGQLSLPMHHRMYFNDMPGGVPGVQGADFSANGNLYLAGDVDGKGLWVFDSAGYLRAEHHVPAKQGLPWRHEIEDVVIWDTDAPNSGFDSQHRNRGQVHVIRRDQELLIGDQLDLWHYRASDLSSL